MQVGENIPTGWFNPMQHLLIHLSYEAKVGDPVQYRWMYHFERALKRLRHMVGNKARVEECIAEEFKYKEIAYFTSVYFTEEHIVNAPTMRYHVHQDDPHSNLSIFNLRDTTISVGRVWHLSEDDQNSALLYMYTILDEMTHYFS
jgi:predicted transcriptional regulator YdeE